MHVSSDLFWRSWIQFSISNPCTKTNSQQQTQLSHFCAENKIAKLLKLAVLTHVARKKDCCLLFYIDCIEIVPIFWTFVWVEIEVKFFMVTIGDLCMAQTIIFHLSSLSMSINFFCIISSLIQFAYCFNSLNCHCCN